MDIFDILTLIGGLSLFLFGMNIMGQSLERRAGGKLRSLLGKLTTNKAAGLLTGLGVTAVIQSSSATTVMVVGFVNSGLMTLKQAINVIMGANIGTTVTAWILSLAGIDSGNLFVKLLKPSSFTPVLALVGIIFYMFCKNDKKKDTGMILLGFATSGYAEFVCFGYKRGDGGELAIDEPDAAIVRKMFKMRAGGRSLEEISNWLYKNRIPSPTGKDRWSRETISKLLRNEKYVGDVMLQKTFVQGLFLRKQVKNRGKLERYLIRDHHPPIVSRELFAKANRMDKSGL